MHASIQLIRGKMRMDMMHEIKRLIIYFCIFDDHR